MLANSLLFIYKEDINTIHGVILYDANQVSEGMHSQLKVVE